MPKRFIFKPDNWFTEQTYGNNYKSLPSCCGVYLLVSRDVRGWPLIKKVRHKILYVGSSKNLKRRCSKHSTANEIKKSLPPMVDLVTYFLPCENYIDEEKRLIKLTQARYNKQWR